MAIALRSPNGTSTTASTAQVTTITHTVPTGVVNGDLLIWVISQSNTATNPVADPTGWTRIQAATNTTMNTTVWYRVAASEPASYASPTLTSGMVTSLMVAYTGVDNATPLDVTVPTAVGTATGTFGPFPAITPLTAGAWVLGVGNCRFAASATIPSDTNLTSTNLTIDAQHASQATSASIHDDAGLGHAAWTSGAFTPNMASTLAASATLSQTIALRPAATVTVRPAQPRIRLQAVNRAGNY